MQSSQIQDPVLQALVTQHCMQITPEWEMKMGVIAKDDGGYNFSGADALMNFAKRHGLAVHGHTLVWYSQAPKVFQRLEGTGDRFRESYRRYINQVVRRYRGRIRSWDVVNEPVMPEGNGYRVSLWSDNLGADDHIYEAFESAREADPDAILFINEYGLELRPEKRRLYLQLIERLLRRGAKIQGIGTQCHMDPDVKPSEIRASIRDLAAVGLPIHVSEVDITFGRNAPTPAELPARRELQIRQLEELTQAFLDLPSRQRYAFTFWGLRDRDSWWKKPNLNRWADEPLPFDDDGRPKALAHAFARKLQSRSE